MHRESELRAAWQQSKTPMDHRKVKTVEPAALQPPAPDRSAASLLRGSGCGGQTESEKIVEERDGHPRFMELLLREAVLQAKHLGLLCDTIRVEQTELLVSLEELARARGQAI